ncbi:hypothetical protein [Flavobacterium ovatum]
MKTHSLDEVTDKFVGKKGTANRDNFENELKTDLIDQTIKKSQKK